MDRIAIFLKKKENVLHFVIEVTNGHFSSTTYMQQVSLGLLACFCITNLTQESIMSGLLSVSLYQCWTNCTLQCILLGGCQACLLPAGFEIYFWPHLLMWLLLFKLSRLSEFSQTKTCFHTLHLDHRLSLFHVIQSTVSSVEYAIKINLYLRLVQSDPHIMGIFLFSTQTFSLIVCHGIFPAYAWWFIFIFISCVIAGHSVSNSFTLVH